MIINYLNKFLPKLYLLNYQEKAFYHMYDFYLNNLINGVNDVKKNIQENSRFWIILTIKND